MEGRVPHAQIGLTEKVVKDLQERSLEKRLSAATIIERDIEERLRDNDYASVSTRILYFKQLTQDFSNITNRRSGLFGLSFVGMAIYHKLRVSILNIFEISFSTFLTLLLLSRYNRTTQICSTKLWSSSWTT